MTNLYLVAHNCRGEPCFDIAARCDDMGTESDPGTWWIHNTGGWRIYPYWVQSIDGLTIEGAYGLDHVALFTDMPDDARDCFEARYDRQKDDGHGLDLLAKLSLVKPREPIRRRA